MNRIAWEKHQALKSEYKEQSAFKRVLRLDPCAYCGELGGTIDHIIAKSLTTERGPNNWTGACSTCNNTKDQQDLLGFLLATAS